MRIAEMFLAIMAMMAKGTSNLLTRNFGAPPDGPKQAPLEPVGHSTISPGIGAAVWGTTGSSAAEGTAFGGVNGGVIMCHRGSRAAAVAAV
jgi:hypothetical protein